MHKQKPSGPSRSGGSSESHGGSRWSKNSLVRYTWHFLPFASNNQPSCNGSQGKAVYSFCTTDATKSAVSDPKIFLISSTASLSFQSKFGSPYSRSVDVVRSRNQVFRDTTDDVVFRSLRLLIVFRHKRTQPLYSVASIAITFDLLSYSFIWIGIVSIWIGTQPNPCSRPFTIISWNA